LIRRNAVDLFGAFSWLAGIVAAGFLVSWLLTDIFSVNRYLYVGALALVTGVMAGGYLLWSELGIRFWTHNWVWGIVTAAVTGAFLALLVRRAPTPEGSRRGLRPAKGLWEGLVYGASEGILLSTVPVLAIWQGIAGREWTDGWLGVGAGVSALAASALVIVVHHWGYREYRSRAVLRPLTACLVLSVGYLLTASPIAAVGGHIVLHLAMLRRGMELPPHARPARAPQGPVLAR